MNDKMEKIKSSYRYTPSPKRSFSDTHYPEPHESLYFFPSSSSCYSLVPDPDPFPPVKFLLLKLSSSHPGTLHLNRVARRKRLPVLGVHLRHKVVELRYHLLVRVDRLQPVSMQPHNPP